MHVFIDVKPEDHENFIAALEQALGKRPMTNAERQKKYRDEKRNETVTESNENVTERNETATKESTKENIYILNNIPEDINNSLNELNSLEELNNTPKELNINTIGELKEKEIKKEKEKKKAERKERREERKFGKKPYGQFQNVFLTDEELDKFQKQFPDWEHRIEEMSMGIASKGYSYKSHYAALLNWARNSTPVIQRQPVQQPHEETWMEVAERIQRERDAQNALVEL